MRILHAVPDLRLAAGGPSRSVASLASALAQNGTEVFVARILGEAEEITLPKNVFFGSIESGEFVLDSGRRLDIHHFDIIHSHSLWLRFCHQVSKLAHEQKIPLIVSPRGTLEPWALNYRKWKKRLAWIVYQKRDLQHCGGLHATSEGEANSLHRLGLRPQIWVVPNGISTLGENSLAAVGRRERKAIYLGRFHPVKNLKTLLSAWAKLKPKGWILELAGPDENGHRAELEATAKHLGIDDSTKFCDPIEGKEKKHFLRSASFLILPSFTENFGMVVLEALASGTPVLASKGTPWKDLETFQCGWWVDPSIEGIFNGLEKALKCKPEVRKEMGKQGLSLVRHKYEWGAVSREMLNVYNQVLGLAN